jgi:hypothetical protein
MTRVSVPQVRVRFVHANPGLRFVSFIFSAHFESSAADSPSEPKAPP